VWELIPRKAMREAALVALDNCDFGMQEATMLASSASTRSGIKRDVSGVPRPPRTDVGALQGGEEEDMVADDGHSDDGEQVIGSAASEVRPLGQEDADSMVIELEASSTAHAARMQDARACGDNVNAMTVKGDELEIFMQWLDEGHKKFIMARLMEEAIRKEAEQWTKEFTELLKSKKVLLKDREEVFFGLLGDGKMLTQVGRTLWSAIGSNHYNTWRGLPVESFVKDAADGGGINTEFKGRVNTLETDAQRLLDRSTRIVRTILREGVLSVKMRQHLASFGIAYEENAGLRVDLEGRVDLVWEHILALRMNGAVITPKLILRGLEARLTGMSETGQNISRKEGLMTSPNTNRLVENLAGQTAEDAVLLQLQQLLEEANKRVDNQEYDYREVHIWLYDNFNPLRFNALIQKDKRLAQVIASITRLMRRLERSFIKNDPTLPPMNVPFTQMHPDLVAYTKTCALRYAEHGMGVMTAAAPYLDRCEWINTPEWQVKDLSTILLSSWTQHNPLGYKSSSFKDMTAENGILASMCKGAARGGPVLLLCQDSEPAAHLFKMGNEWNGAKEARAAATAAVAVDEADTNGVPGGGRPGERRAG
jgi:hypothetical protein